MQANAWQDKCVGCFLRACVGDVLGSGVEFLDLEKVQQMHPDGVKDFLPVDGECTSKSSIYYC